jgi:hypothetical protein
MIWHLMVFQLICSAFLAFLVLIQYYDICYCMLQFYCSVVTFVIMALPHTLQQSDFNALKSSKNSGEGCGIAGCELMMRQILRILPFCHSREFLSLTLAGC